MNIGVPLENEGYFFARPETVGSSEAEIQACGRGEVPMLRATEIIQRTVSAMDSLKEMQVEGRC